MKVIYGYRRKDLNKLVYIGQTGRITKRRYEHEILEAFNTDREEFNYPLSRAIRKYGIENFDFVILEENIPNIQANDREKYWIKYYNTYNDGYNQTPGGDAKIEITDEDIDDIYQMLKDNIPYEKIAKRMKLCCATISAINNGLSYRREDITYPISSKPFGKRLPSKIVEEVTQLLIDKQIKVRDIAKLYNIGFNVVVRINSGESYYRENLDYPLRKGRVREKQSINYQELLNKAREILDV